MKLKKLFVCLVLVLVLSLTLTACSAFQGQPLPFFEGYNWQDLIGFVFYAVLGFWPGFNIFQILKEKFHWADSQAHWAVLGFSAILTFLAMLVTGQFDFTNFDLTLRGLIEFGATFYTAMQVAYQRFKTAQAKELGLY